MPAVIIVSLFFIGVCWVIKHYWPFVLVVVFCIWGLPLIVRVVSWKLKNYKKRLGDHKNLESDQNKLFLRFSDKQVALVSFHPIYFLFVMIGVVLGLYTVGSAHSFVHQEGWIDKIPENYQALQYIIWGAVFCFIVLSIFSITIRIANRFVSKVEFYPSYGQLLKRSYKAKDAHEALKIAPSLRAAASYHVRSLYDLFVARCFLISKTHDPAFYKNDRLLDTLSYLEAYFPHSDIDESFRRRYWNYARHIFRILHFRECPEIESSMFALPYPETEEVRSQELKDRLKSERDNFKSEPISVWIKSPNEITLNDALEIIGLNDVPPVTILHKLHLAVLGDHKDDPKKRKLTVKAFEVLGHEAVQQEMA